MSELGGNYYQERAERLGIEQIPSILDGQPVLLTEEAHTIPVHKSGSDTSVAFATQLESTHDFILACTPAHCTTEKDTPSWQAENNSRFCRNLIGKLLVPKEVATGKVCDIRIEAIAKPEIKDTVPKRLMHAHKRSFGLERENEDTEVYFGLTATLLRGARRTPVMGIVLARATLLSPSGNSRLPERVVGVGYLGGFLSKNTLLGGPLLGDASAPEEKVRHATRTLPTAWWR